MSRVKQITGHLVSHLIEKIVHASMICILTSFDMKSGVELLRDLFNRSAE